MTDHATPPAASADPHAIDTLARLEALLGKPSDASVYKEVPCVHPAYRAMIEASPFVMLATSGPGGLDASPRGDPAGLCNCRTTRPCCCLSAAATTVPKACATS